MDSTTDAVQNYQSMFAYRYSADDKEYQKYLQRSANSPPIVEDWMNSASYMFTTMGFLMAFRRLETLCTTSSKACCTAARTQLYNCTLAVNKADKVPRGLTKEPSAPSVSEILQNYTNKFAHRFTSEDEEYQKYVQRPADSPPLIEDWRNKSGGNQRYRDRSRDNRRLRNSVYRSVYEHSGGYRSDHWHEKGYGSNYSQHQHGQSSYPQHGWPQRGYGSYFQESRYGRY